MFQLGDALKVKTNIYPVYLKERLGSSNGIMYGKYLDK